MKKIKNYREYHQINEEDENIDDILGDDENTDMDTDMDISDDIEEEAPEIDSRFSPEDMIQKELEKIKLIINNIFVDGNDIGDLTESTISNNYTNYTLKLKYNDGEYEYNCYIEIPLEEVVDNKKIKTIYFKMKKYLETKLVGERDEELNSVSDFSQDFLIKINTDLDSDFNINKEEEDLGLEFEGE